jgi:hypothetical protein
LSTPPPTEDALARYEIKMQGRLSDSLAGVFEKFTAAVKPAERRYAAGFAIKPNCTDF